MNLGAMAIKGCSAFAKAPVLLESHHPIVLVSISIVGKRGSLTPLQRYSRCILQLTGQKYIYIYIYMFMYKYVYLYVCIYIFMYFKIGRSTQRFIFFKLIIYICVLYIYMFPASYFYQTRVWAPLLECRSPARYPMRHGEAPSLVLLKEIDITE